MLSKTAGVCEIGLNDMPAQTALPNQDYLTKVRVAVERYPPGYRCYEPEQFICSTFSQEVTSATQF